MLLQTCNKNHFYNMDKFKQCPYCALEKSGIEEDTDVFSVRSTEKTDPIIDYGNKKKEINKTEHGRT